MLTEEQLKMRSKGIGGSDAGVIAGVSPHKTALQLYYEKRGELPQDDIAHKPEIVWGNALEDVILKQYEARTGREIIRFPETLQHNEYAWMLGNLDAGTTCRRVVEVKTSGLPSEWGPEGTDEINESYLLQGQHYLAITGFEVVDFAVLILGRDFRIYEIPRDDALIESLIEIERDFWFNRVLAGNPPDVDYNHRTAKELLKKMYPGTNGETVHFSSMVMDWHSVKMEALERAKEYQKVAEIASNHIVRTMGEASVGMLPDGTAYTRKLVKRKGYEVKESEYIALKHTKNTKKLKEITNG